MKVGLEVTSHCLFSFWLVKRSMMLLLIQLSIWDLLVFGLLMGKVGLYLLRSKQWVIIYNYLPTNAISFLFWIHIKIVMLKWQKSKNIMLKGHIIFDMKPFVIIKEKHIIIIIKDEHIKCRSWKDRLWVSWA